MPFTGRHEILTSETEITRDNIVGVLQKALITHAANRGEIHYLWRYYKGAQPVLDRIKEVRPEICNKVVENHAYEITTFTSAYELGEPLQYICRSGSEALADDITKLNEYQMSEEAASKDMELTIWRHVCGVGYKMVLPDEHAGVSEIIEDAPYEIFVLDPRYTFIVRNNGLGKHPLMGVRFVKDALGDVRFSCYTRTHYYEIVNDSVVREETHILGDIPIEEYRLNSAMLGVFEPVLPMLDAINTTESNRVDGVEQFVQALMVFYNVDISSEDFDQIKVRGGLKVKDMDPTMKARVEYLVNHMNQGETQVLVDHMYETVLTIVGMPNRNGGSSTSDTGVAVIYRDGWSEAESYAKLTESEFRKAERRFLRLILRICRGFGEFGDLKVSDIRIQFTRRNYENIQGKAQVLIQMLASDKIHPRLAFEHCGMFPDPDLAYKLSEEWIREQEKKAEKKQKEMLAQQGGAQNAETGTDTGNDREDTGSAQARKQSGSADRAGEDSDS